MKTEVKTQEVVKTAPEQKETLELPIENDAAQDTIKAKRPEAAIKANIKYKPEFCELLIKHLSKGSSFDTFGGLDEVSVARSTVYAWFEEYPEFKEAKHKAEQKAQAFFEDRLAVKISGQDVKGIESKKIDTTCLIFALKTRFHKTYGDRQKIEYSADDATKKAIKLAYDVKE